MYNRAFKSNTTSVRTLAGGSLSGTGCKERTNRQKSCRDLRTNRNSWSNTTREQNELLALHLIFTKAELLKIPTWVISSWFLADRLASRPSRRRRGSARRSQGRLGLRVNVVLNLQGRIQRGDVKHTPCVWEFTTTHHLSSPERKFWSTRSLATMLKWVGSSDRVMASRSGWLHRRFWNIPLAIRHIRWTCETHLSSVKTESRLLPPTPQRSASGFSPCACRPEGPFCSDSPSVSHTSPTLPAFSACPRKINSRLFF